MSETQKYEIVVECVVIDIDNFMTDLMQAADVFESFKVVGRIRNTEIIMTTEDPSVFKQTTMLKLLASVHKSNKEEVAFFHVVSIRMGQHVILNDRYRPYVKEGVGVVSDGDKWFLLTHFMIKILSGTGITFEVNNMNFPKPNKILTYV